MQGWYNARFTTVPYNVLSDQLLAWYPYFSFFKLLICICNFILIISISSWSEAERTLIQLVKVKENIDLSLSDSVLLQNAKYPIYNGTH